MEATRVTVDEVKQRLDRGEPLQFVDSRNPEAWGESDSKMPSAVRIPADEVGEYLNQLDRDRALITYCT